MVAFWIWQPGLALGLFLLLSAVHFGYGDATGATAVSRMVQIAAHGGVAVFGISLFHLQQVTPLFAALTGGDLAVAVLMVELFPLVMISVAGLYLICAIREPYFGRGSAVHCGKLGRRCYDMAVAGQR